MSKLNKTPITILVRRGLTANVKAATTYSAQGELGYTTDDKCLYASDGTIFRQIATTLTVVAKTGAYTATTTDSVILCNTSGGAFAITLPNATTCKGKTYTIKDSANSAAANNITVNTNGGNIDGAATQIINTNYGIVTVISDGTNWFTI